MACPSAGSPFADTWCPWPHNGSLRGSSDADLHSRHPDSQGEGRESESDIVRPSSHKRPWLPQIASPRPGEGGWHSPGDRDNRPSPLGCLYSRSGYRGKSALPHTPRFPQPRESHGPGGQPGGPSPPPSRRIGPSRCTCTQLGSSAGGPHSTQPARDRVAFTSLHPHPPPSPHGGLGSPVQGRQVGTHVRQLAAGPAPTQAGAAGLPHGAAGVLVTAHVSAVRQGGLAGRHLLQSSHRLASLLTMALGQARVAMGAAMLVV